MQEIYTEGDFAHEFVRTVSRLVETGCASTLAVEISDGGSRLVVNCGGARAGGAGMAPALVQGLRTTAAHSTLTLSDSNSTSIHADGSLGKGVEAMLDDHPACVKTSFHKRAPSRSTTCAA